MVVFKYKNGVSFAKSTAVEHGGFARRQIVVVGTKGTVEIHPLEWYAESENNLFAPQITVTRESFSESWGQAGEKSTSDVFGRYETMFRSFSEFVRGEKENPVSGEYEKKLHKLLLKSCGVEL